MTIPLSIGEYTSSDSQFTLAAITAAPAPAIVTSKFEDSPALTPDLISYAAKLHPCLRTRKPFIVQFARAEGGFTAYVAETEEYGVGATKSQALDDLGRTLAELYFSLERDSDRLSEGLLAVRDSLHLHLELVHRP